MVAMCFDLTLRYLGNNCFCKYTLEAFELKAYPTNIQ